MNRCRAPLAHLFAGAIVAAILELNASVAHALTPSQGKAAAVAWLLAHQNPSGSWGSDARNEELATAHVLRTLRAVGVSSPQIRRAEAWLASRSPGLTQDLAEMTLALHDSDLGLDVSAWTSELHTRQVTRDTGTIYDPTLSMNIDLENEYAWGVHGEERANLIDSAVALRALEEMGETISQVTKSTTYLRETQNTSGGDSGGWPLARETTLYEVLWPGFSEALESEVVATASVVRAANWLLGYDPNLATDVSEAISWLRSVQDPSGGWGKGSTTPFAETALAYLALRESGVAASDPDLDAALTGHLLPGQITTPSDPDYGSWDGEAHTTALALQAIEASGLATDTDGDGLVDAVDPDDDDDGVLDGNDPFPLDASESADLDGDGLGDGIDPDRDGDGFCDPGENDPSCSPGDGYPDDPNAHMDFDGDGTPDAYDPDIDGDEVDNIVDAFPLDPSETADADRDGQGDNADPDDDNDRLPDAVETNTLSYAWSQDTGSDPLDWDTDGDGVMDGDDGYVLDPCCSLVIPEDLDKELESDGVTHVGLADFAIFSASYGLPDTDPKFHPDADFVVDGLIDDLDLQALEAAFGQSALP